MWSAKAAAAAGEVLAECSPGSWGASRPDPGVNDGISPSICKTVAPAPMLLCGARRVHAANCGHGESQIRGTEITLPS